MDGSSFTIPSETPCADPHAGRVVTRLAGLILKKHNPGSKAKQYNAIHIWV